jgi:hypothetical protein
MGGRPGAKENFMVERLKCGKRRWRGVGGMGGNYWKFSRDEDINPRELRGGGASFSPALPRPFYEGPKVACLCFSTVRGGGDLQTMNKTKKQVFPNHGKIRREGGGGLS